MKLLQLLVAISLFTLAFANEDAKRALEKEGVKVLYVTHLPGKYHNYVEQLKYFKEIVKTTTWKVDYIAENHDKTIEKLKAKDFAKGYDVVIYNICMAKTKDTELVENMISQTRDNGVPALLIHCAMHSFWATFVKDRRKKQDASTPDPKLVQEWQEKNGDKAFPSWGDFMGVASAKHTKQSPITVTKVKGDHPLLEKLPDNWTTAKTELYLELYRAENVTPLLMGSIGKKKAPVLWTHKRGKAYVVGFSLGHGKGDWIDPIFRKIIVDSVDLLDNTNN